MALRAPSPLPGFGLSLGIALPALSAIGPADLWGMIDSPRIWSALAFRAAFVASAFNLVLGLLLSWVLVRYRFPARA